MLPVMKMEERSIDAAIGARIRSLRLHNGLTQQKLAARLGVTFQQVQKYERGTNQINPTRLLKVASIFGVSAGVLLGEEKPTTPRDQLPEILACSPDKNAIRMFEAFQKVKDPKLRQELSTLIQRIAGSDGSS
jgi:transcriptional regulator with XRE-family HTH domain